MYDLLNGHSGIVSNRKLQSFCFYFYSGQHIHHSMYEVLGEIATLAVLLSFKETKGSCPLIFVELVKQIWPPLQETTLTLETKFVFMFTNFVLMKNHPLSPIVSKSKF